MPKARCWDRNASSFIAAREAFAGIGRDLAAALQKCALAEGRDRDLLFRQSQRIAEALDKGELALAQIFGLHIPVANLDDRQLARISRISFAKAYNPDEPRVPEGNPHGGEWTTGGTSGAAPAGSADAGADNDDGGGDDGGGDDGGDGSGSSDGSSPPATGEGPPGSPEAAASSGDQANGGDTAPPDNSIEIKWPDASRIGWHTSSPAAKSGQRSRNPEES
jgi:hypothetical protein